MLGKDLIIKEQVGSDFVGIAGAQSCDITTECDINEVSSPSTGKAKTYMAGRTGWKIDVGYLVSASAIGDLLKVGKTYRLQVKEGSSATVLVGDAICQQCHVTAQVDSLAKGSFSFQGTGELL